MLSAVIPEEPNPHHPHIREIVEQERLAEILSRLGVSARKLDDIIGGFSFLVGRRPDIFAQESETGWSRIVMNAFPPDIPLIRIWFTYDDDHVYIEHVELLEE
jgi:hypothetical protein